MAHERRIFWGALFLENTDNSIDGLEARAACLINPASGIANDYLNMFNEILLMIENMPILLPEMVDDLEKWTPVSYREYFGRSPLPGSAKALKAYDNIDPVFRSAFERQISVVAEIAKESRATILAMRKGQGEIDPDQITEPCQVLAIKLREALDTAADMVNNGAAKPKAQLQLLAETMA